MKEFVLYTLARLGVFVATYAVIAGVYLLVTGDNALPVIWPLLLAIVVSAVLSGFLLKGMREQVAASIERRAHAASRRFEEMRSREDED